MDVAPADRHGSEGERHGELRVVPLDAIVVPARRMRRDLGDVDALALSLHLHGQLAPVVVFQSGERYYLVAGERRLEAARRLHAARMRSGDAAPGDTGTIAALVRPEMPPDLAREIELAENAQRRELTDEEEADAMIQMVREDGREMREVAAISGRSVAYVSKRIRMFEDASLRAALLTGTITPAQAEELLILPEEERPDFLRVAVASGWGSKEIRDAVRARQSGDSLEVVLPTPAGPFEDAAYGADDDLGDDTEQPIHFRTENETGAILIERPRDLTRRIIELEAVLRDLRPFQLKARDDRALRQLWHTLRALAQAPRVPTAPVFPSLADAEAKSRRR
jgi:ParB/RepB/Spo0J family partition protein